VAALREVRVTWVITARRWLLAGLRVSVVPQPITMRRKPVPPRRLARASPRWNPVALDLADSLVASGVTSAAELHERLEAAPQRTDLPVEPGQAKGYTPGSAHLDSPAPHHQPKHIAHPSSDPSHAQRREVHARTGAKTFDSVTIAVVP
jgi:hypothetical protein